jgi:succinyl-diaminopimelate desuccinylase
MIAEILSLLKTLIRYKAITPRGKESLDFIAYYLRTLGFECLVKSFDPKREIFNLYARMKPNASGFNLCFAGHVDVVPAGNLEAWDYTPFNMSIEKDRIYGRGAVDMLGAIACFLVAINKFINAHQAEQLANISVLLTTDEEGEGIYGTKKMLEYLVSEGEKIDFCILGEPTANEQIGDIIKIGRRGSFNAEIQILGQQGHVAYPEKAHNPIRVLVNILHELQNMQLDAGAGLTNNSHLEITSLEAENHVSNITPQAATARFNIRFNQDHTPELLYGKIEAIIKKYTDNYCFEYKCNSLPFMQRLCPQIEAFATIVQQHCGITPIIGNNGGTSDARFIHQYTKVVECGLKSAQAHQINEHTQISDLQMLYNVYYDSLMAFCRL